VEQKKKKKQNWREENHGQKSRISVTRGERQVTIEIGRNKRTMRVRKGEQKGHENEEEGKRGDIGMQC